MLKPRQRAKLVERGQKVENFLKKGCNNKVIVFSNEKDFIDQYLNRPNNLYTAPSTKNAAHELKCVGARKHPAKASMLDVVMSDGKGSMDALRYKSFLIRRVFPLPDDICGRSNYIWA